MSSSNPSRSASDRVNQWLQTSGAALELRVAAAFTGTLGSGQVQHARQYIDADSGLLREIDVVAIAHEQPEVSSDFLRLTAVIECKSSAANPWVAFSNGHQPAYNNNAFLDHVRHRTARCGSDSLDMLGRRLLSPVGERYAYHVADCANASRDQSKSGSSRNQAWDACRQVLAATDAVLRADPDVRTQVRYMSLFLPVIVTAAPLFIAGLAGDGMPASEEVDSLPWRAQSASSMAPGGVGYRWVWVVNERALDTFVGEFKSAISNLRLTSSSR